MTGNTDEQTNDSHASTARAIDPTMAEKVAVGVQTGQEWTAGWDGQIPVDGDEDGDTVADIRAFRE